MHEPFSTPLALGWLTTHLSRFSRVHPPALLLLVPCHWLWKALSLGLCLPLGLQNTQKAEKSSREVVGGGMAVPLCNAHLLLTSLSLVRNSAHLASILINTKPFLQLHMPCRKASNHTYHINTGFLSHCDENSASYSHFAEEESEPEHTGRSLAQTRLSGCQTLGQHLTCIASLKGTHCTSRG